MHKSLASILGLALGSAVAYSPLPATAQTAEESEAYQYHADHLHRFAIFREVDIQYAKAAQAVKLDPLSRVTNIERFLNSCSGKVVVLPQTYFPILDSGIPPKNSKPYDWLPFLKESSQHQKIIVVFPSAPPHDIENKRFGVFLNAYVKKLFRGVVKLGIGAKGVYDPTHLVITSAYLSDFEEGKRIKAIQSKFPGRLIFIVGEDLARFVAMTSDNNVPVGTPVTYRKAGLDLMLLYPIDHTITRILDDIRSRDASTLHMYSSDEIKRLKESEKREIEESKADVGGFIDGWPSSRGHTGRPLTIYIPHLGSTK